MTRVHITYSALGNLAVHEMFSRSLRRTLAKNHNIHAVIKFELESVNSELQAFNFKVSAGPRIKRVIENHWREYKQERKQHD